MRRARIILLGGILVGPALLWFLGVDSFVFSEQCEQCHWGRTVGQIRFLRFPVWQKTVEHHHPWEWIARDLGVPCRHQRLRRWETQRHWGLLIPDDRYHDVLVFVQHSGWYGPAHAQAAREMARQDPNLGAEFRLRALQQQDLDYWREFARRLPIGEPNAARTAPVTDASSAPGK